MKKLIISGTLLAVLMAILVLWKGRPLYRELLGHRLLAAAEKATQKKDRIEARRLYTLAIAKLPNDPQAMRSCASFLEQTNDASLVSLRGRLWALNPKDPEACLDYADAALRFGERRAARNILHAKTQPPLTENARYYHLVSVWHFVAGELPEADAACAEAMKRAPENLIYQVNRATIELASPDPSVREKSIAALEKLSLQKPVAVTAFQSLLRFASKSPEEPKALQKWLDQSAAVIPPGDLLFTVTLDAVRRWRPRQYPAALESFLKGPRSNAPNAEYVERWLEERGADADLLAFRASLRPEWQQSTQALQGAAKALDGLQKSQELQALLEEPGWKEIPALHRAWEERLRRQGRATLESRTIDPVAWAGVLASAKKNPSLLYALVDLALSWKWPEEYAQSLWAVADDVPQGSPDALADLSRFYLARNDAHGLFKVVDRQFTADPRNPFLANNFVFLSFLLGFDTARAEKISREIWQADPRNPMLTSTRAFGLLKAGKIAEGVALFQTLDPAALRGSNVGVAYGLLLAAQGNPDARPYLAGADRWIRFPEEKELLAKALANLEHPPAK